MNNKIRIKLNKLSKSPGVYFFKNKKSKIIYIGKANNLRARTRQYFTRDKNQHQKIKALVSETAKIEWQICESGIDALIQEARLIKKYRPKFNVLLRDDKNYFFVAITKEIFPRIFITHQPLKTKSYQLKADFIGPFTEGRPLKQTLKILRKIYPYCACKTHVKKPCLQYHLGLCLGPSIHPERKKAIRQNISAIKQILNGKRQTLLKKMRSQMMESAKKENFTKAGELKNKIESLENIFAHRLFLGVAVIRRLLPFCPRALRLAHKTQSSEAFAESWLRSPSSRVDPSQTQIQRWEKAKNSLQIFIKNKKEIRRVEGYDISNIGGQYAVGSMVVFVDGLPDKSQYRKFKIKYSGAELNPVRGRFANPDRNFVSDGARGTASAASRRLTSNGASDPKMMAEVLARRTKHKEWLAPDLIIVDGGITQLNAARAILPKNQPVISLAKKEEEIYAPNRPPIHAAQLGNETKLFLQHLRDEAHRFAISYHRKLRRVILSEAASDAAKRRIS